MFLLSLLRPAVLVRGPVVCGSAAIALVAFAWLMERAFDLRLIAG